MPIPIYLDANQADSLLIGGLTPFTTVDYPGYLAAVVWVQGCPWRCRYCHNPHLQVRGKASALVWEEVYDFFEQRVGLLDAVVFSGGEATVDKALPAAMQILKTLGYRIGLHTAGAYPDRLAVALPLCDWVGLDVKALWADYDALTATPGSAMAARDSFALVQRSGVPYQIRTTVHDAWLPPDKLEQLKCELASQGVKEHVLQPFRQLGCIDCTLSESDWSG
ncbi:anaerobic ribonucleoside-triphosphate reductase activating protein [Chitinivorax sp. B]|uniref:anaerobic ribonucleoside-triphosphate reductase activating protein n=1 Tax=Chitinivorax sp. B TaxID=2502235 RepID=UPI0010F9D5C5|nr:anaerobic ribonucleoside-triphosphate reductase activating protein [Chitinivorax sp. B]